MKKTILALGVLILFLSVSTYGWAKAPRILTVYCGITMVKPLEELSVVFEKRNYCKVRIISGGSGTLMEQLLKNKDGDLFLPGSAAYIDTLKKEHPGLIVDTRHVGYNRAAIFVKEGNPKEISSDLENLMNPEYRVIIGASEKGSIGKETRQLLIRKGIYDQVLKNTRVTLHSESLVKALISGNADIAVNWYAVSTWPENEKAVDAIPIDEAWTQKKKLVFARLSDSKEPNLAQAFLLRAASDTGKAMFKKYGLD